MYETYGLTVLKMHIVFYKKSSQKQCCFWRATLGISSIVDHKQWFGCDSMDLASGATRLRGFTNCADLQIAQIYKLRRFTNCAQKWHEHSLYDQCTGLTEKYGTNVGEIFLKNADCHAAAVT